jgi:hypothetical protein
LEEIALTIRVQRTNRCWTRVHPFTGLIIGVAGFLTTRLLLPLLFAVLN